MSSSSLSKRAASLVAAPVFAEELRHGIVAFRTRRDKSKLNNRLPFRETVSEEENSLERRHALLRRKASYFSLCPSPFSRVIPRNNKNDLSLSLSFPLSLFFVPVLIDISSVAEAHCFLRFHYRHLCAPPIRTKRHFRRHSPLCAHLICRVITIGKMRVYLRQRERER